MTETKRIHFERLKQVISNYLNTLQLLEGREQDITIQTILTFIDSLKYDLDSLLDDIFKPLQQVLEVYE